MPVAETSVKSVLKKEVPLRHGRPAANQRHCFLLATEVSPEGVSTLLKNVCLFSVC
jgi:hypothetical protein